MKTREIPGYREMLRERAAATAEAQFADDVAFLSDLVGETICGLPVLPFNMQHMLLLRVGDCPFITGGSITPIAVGQFLWVVSPHYHPKARVKRWLFLKSIRRMDFETVVKAILEYLAAAFEHAPGSNGKSAPATFSGTAALMDATGAEYGWTRAEVLHCPIKVLCQLRKARCARHGMPDHGGSRADRVAQDWLNARNGNRTN